MQNKILILDDELGICTSLTLALEDKYIVKAVTEPLEALKYLNTECFNICLLDLKIGKYNGLEVLKKIKEIDKNIVVIMMTAFGSIDSSVEAIKNGAYSYLSKPLNITELYVVIEQALEYQYLNSKVEYLSQKLEKNHIFNDMVGRSHAMKKVFQLIDKLKDVDTNVVVTGESGTGKELVARAIHYSGKRNKEIFEEVNCAAIPEGLLEGELFGFKKGAFTGAINDKQGKFEYANNGTIFLDEIGDMSLQLQAKLLRVLQNKDYTPLGSNEKKKLNIRIIAATNKDLKTEVEAGRFRQDLFFRLNVIEIHLPPLRQRKQDLPLLFNHFIQQYNKELNKNIRGLSNEAERKLLEYDYSGNVRELSNIIEYAMVLSPGDIININDLPQEVKQYGGQFSISEGLFAENLMGLSLKEIEKRVIILYLKKNNNNKRATAAMLKISEKGLRNKIKEYEI